MVPGRPRLAGWLPLAFVGLFLGWPLVALALEALDAGGLLEVAGRSSTRSVLWRTAWQAALSTVLTLAVGLPAAAALALVDLPGRRALQALLTVPFVLPTVVVAGAFRSLFHAVGADLDRSVTAVLAAHVFFNVPLVVRIVGQHWRLLGRAPEEAARLLGASRRRVFTTVTLPRVAPAVAAAAALTALFTFTSFGVVLLLGPLTFRTMETEIYRQALVRTDFETAAALAAIQVLAVAALSIWTATTQRRLAVPEADAVPRAASRSAAARGAAVAALAPAVVLAVAPLAVMVGRSCRADGSWTLRNYRALGDRVQLLPVSAVDALRNSLEVALVATAVALVVGVAASVAAARPARASRGRFATLVDVSTTLPAGVSAVALGMGMLVAFDEDPLAWRRSWWMIPAAHALIGVPFVVRTVLPALRAIDPRLSEAARTLGAGPYRVARDIEVRQAGRSVAVGAAFAFAISLGEFGASTMLARSPSQTTAPLALARLLSQPGEVLQGQAAALATVLAGAVAAVVLISDRTGGHLGRR